MNSRAVFLSERSALPYLYKYDPVLSRENLDFSETAET